VDTHVISDVTGQTGLAIVNAILEGERNPVALAKLRNVRIQASKEVIPKSLVGDYRSEHSFTLQQSLTAYRSYRVTTHHNSMPVISPLIKSVFTNARKLNSVPKRELSDPNSSPWNRRLE
jgi:hypothetical protein